MGRIVGLVVEDTKTKKSKAEKPKTAEKETTKKEK